MPDISPARGEIGLCEDFRQSHPLQKWRGVDTGNLPLAGEMAGRPEGGLSRRHF
ncbi:propionyl-coenzyme A carboxylase alpha polypeptide [Mesorhizobium sp. M1B.F.Ca.ET.045.04.1.1]|nr:propionyl-coenzyme A carboxylase alpha polypeptide [Mesorhizobium sp. M1B.F.Ca.ET.045.04.1.1]